MNDAAFDEYTRQEAEEGYSWSARYIANFVDAYLKEDKEAMAFMQRTPPENKAPRHMMSLNVSRGKGTPATRDTFLAQIGEHGFGQIVEIYDALHAKNPELTVDPVEIDNWGGELLKMGRAQDAVQVFRLGLHAYPEPIDFLYDDLAEAYEKAGDRVQAIANYKRTLEINPKHVHAADRLKALGGK